MNAAELILLAAQAAEVLARLRANYEAVRNTLSIDDQAKLITHLEAIHAENLALSGRLDAKLAEAEKR